MHWFIVTALVLAAVSILWYIRAAQKRERPEPPPGAEEDFRQWLEAPAVLEALARAVEVLTRLMSHPKLGGPGFLTLRLPQPGEDGAVTVTAQYPNIREELYRLTARRELGRETLLSAGVPEVLLDLSPDFETDSGGVVVVSVRAAVMSPVVVGCVSGRSDRQEALSLLTDRLGQRFPALEVRPFGTELLLTPVREAVR
ncbi:MAG: hypothetical protein HDT20_05915 [Oscillibacter sp.]|nr:hypothetical protein [Oscillibacter sp.]